MTVVPNHDESSRLDLVEGVRAFNYRRVVAPTIDRYNAQVAAQTKAAPTSKEEAGEILAGDLTYQFSCGLQRNMQQMGWRTAAEVVERHADQLKPALEASRETNVHSELELDPDLQLPDWYTQFDREGRDDIHLVPGGYWGNELIGNVYDLGGAAYRLAWRSGYDARPGALDVFVNSVVPDECRAVLDIGCSMGGVTRVLRKNLPSEVEVVGIDLSAPALTYAHQIAEAGAQAITYSQRDAESTRFDDGSFDLITAFLLMHEVPDPVRKSILEEAFRVLRPGGTLAILDIPPYSALTPERAWIESFDGRGNGENHWEEFLSQDFPGLLKEIGFVDVVDGPLDFDEPGYWGSSALWRTGEFDPIHRWVTTAVKPTS